MERQGLIERLAEAGEGDRDKLAEALKDPAYRDLSLEQALLQSGLVSEEALARAISEEHKVPLVSFDPAGLSEKLAELVPEEMARNYTILPIEREEGVLTLAMADPVDVVAEDLVRHVTKLEVRRVVAPRTLILDGIKALYSSLGAMDAILAKIPKSDIELYQESLESEESDDDLKLSESAPIVQLVNTILSDAIRMRASDIHVEPVSQGLRVRYRIDGLLRNIVVLPRRVQNPVLSRLKLMALMDIAERRIPQDGRIRLLVSNKEVDMRANTLPSYYGEKMVLRVLDKSGVHLDLEDLGFLSEDLASLQQLLDTPQGMLIITGPTGSGKTTTLYAALSRINQETDNLITVEDPVEFELDGITQVPIRAKAGMTFARALRAILRQDPDVVMVGEIRDPETAEIALQAAQTGHLVLSTLHTNDAASSVTRLLHMGLPGYLVGSSLLGVVAQRLVRRLCPHCRVEASPDPQSLKLLEVMALGSMPGRFFSAPGCDECEFSGFRGRAGLYEILVVTDRLRGLILQNAPSRSIKAAAREEGMRLMIEDAVTKIESGLTNLEEVLRVVQVESQGGRTCKTCERPIADEFLVCPFCDPGTDRFCSICGKGLEKDWQTCPYCRARLEREAVPAPAVPSSPPPLPASPPKPTKPPARSVTEPDGMVLVLESDSVQSKILTTLLERRGFPARVVTEPAAALEMAQAERPRAIVADAVLATRDFDLVARLRRQLVTSFIPVVMLTRRDSRTGRLVGLDAGADVYVLKPVDPTQLMTRLKSLLQTDGAPAEAAPPAAPEQS